MGKYFGTDGFRGESNVDLTADHAWQVGRFLGWYFGKLHERRARILIGKDTRRSSYMFEYALAAGLTASGADAYLLHVTTTPSVAFVTRTEGFDCGMMISASHNPYHDNGIKLLSASGEKMDDGVIRLVEDWLDGSVTVFDRVWTELPLARREGIGASVDYVEGRNRYIAYLIGLGKFSFKGMRIGLDCANGAAWHIAKAVFDALGARTYCIHTDPDGFNINRNCGSTHPDSLAELVRRKGLDVGFAYDGDGDRCICVDERGAVVNGDQVLCLCGQYLKERGDLTGDRIVATVMSTLALDRELERCGIQCIRTDVGDRFVYEAMCRTGAVLGGEQSGHIIFASHGTTGDGILTSLKVMEAMLAKKKSLSQLCSGFLPWPQAERNVPVSDKQAAMAENRVRQILAQAETELGKDGRVLLRPSGTEPVIRVMVEGKDREKCEFWAEQIAGSIGSADPGEEESRV